MGVFCGPGAGEEIEPSTSMNWHTGALCRISQAADTVAQLTSAQLIPSQKSLTICTWQYVHVAHAVPA